MTAFAAADVTVLTVGLDPESVGVVADAACAHGGPVSVVSVADAAAGRRWLTERFEQFGGPERDEQLVVLAAFRRDDAWGLSTLFSRLRSLGNARPPRLVLVSDVPVALLPVLITDVRGLRSVPSGSAAELGTHLAAALAEPAAVAS